MLRKFSRPTLPLSVLLCLWTPLAAIALENGGEIEEKALLSPPRQAGSDNATEIPSPSPGRGIEAGFSGSAPPLPQARAVEPVLRIDPAGHKAPIRGIVFTKDGRRLVSAGDDKAVRVWDLQKGRTERTILGRIGPGDEGKIYALALSPDDRYLAVAGHLPDGEGGSGAVRVHDFQSGEVVVLLKGHDRPVLSLAFSPDGRYLASGSKDATVRVRDALEGFSTVGVLRDHRKPVYALAFSPLPDARKRPSGEKARA